MSVECPLLFMGRLKHLPTSLLLNLSAATYTCWFSFNRALRFFVCREIRNVNANAFNSSAACERVCHFLCWCCVSCRFFLQFVLLSYEYFCGNFVSILSLVQFELRYRAVVSSLLNLILHLHCELKLKTKTEKRPHTRTVQNTEYPITRSKKEHFFVC